MGFIGLSAHDVINRLCGFDPVGALSLSEFIRHIDSAASVHVVTS